MGFLTWMKARAHFGPTVTESHPQSPDYSFDRWMQMTKNLDSEIDSMVGDAKKKEKDLEDEKSKQTPDQKEVPEKEDESPELDTKDKETAWKRLKNIAKERSEKATDSSSESEKKSS